MRAGRLNMKPVLSLALSGFLFAVAVAGWLQTPGMGERLFPAQFWDRQMSWVHRQLYRVEMNGAHIQCELAALEQYSAHGFPRLGKRPEPSPKGIAQAQRRLLDTEENTQGSLAEIQFALERVRRQAGLAPAAGGAERGNSLETESSTR